MKLLILTQYFPPEVGAPQNRLFELAVRLQSKGFDITVLTAMPNYPDMVIKPEYRGKFYFTEVMEGITVHRAWIYVSSSKSIVPRLLNYFSFVFTSLLVGLFKVGKQDIVFCESPPLFLGISAYFLKLVKNAKMVFNVSDLWPESAEKLGLVTNKYLLGAATKLEEFLYRKSHLVTGQTKGIVNDIQKRFPNKKMHWLPNGVDLAFYDTNKYSGKEWRAEQGLKPGDKVFLYAGIIGHAQGLEVIIKAAERLKDRVDIQFVLLGSGPVKQDLISLRDSKGLSNVKFLDTVTKKQMPHILAGINSAIVPLKKLELFKGAIPSKIFEALAMEKPIILGVDGEARQLFIEEGKCGLYYEPENDAELSDKIVQLVEAAGLMAELGQKGKKYVSENFSRDKIAEGFAIWLKENC